MQYGGLSKTGLLEVSTVVRSSCHFADDERLTRRASYALHATSRGLRDHQQLQDPCAPSLRCNGTLLPRRESEAGE